MQTIIASIINSCTCFRLIFLAVLVFFVGPIHATLAVNGDGTLTDLTTQLQWDQCPYGLSGATCSTGNTFFGTWSAALNAVVAANNAKYKGYIDWRLPNAKELSSITKTDTYTAGQPAINIAAFPNTPRNAWTSTSYAADPGYAWIIDFNDGITSINLKSNSSLYVRLVRSGTYFDALGPSDAFCQTGSATNPTSAYTVDSINGTVTDLRTQLMWDRCLYPLSGPGCSSNDGAGVASINFDAASNLTVGLGSFKGKTGWRIPTIDELKSLVETCRTRPSINTEIFPNSIWHSDSYSLWSSESLNEINGRFVWFRDGSEGYGAKGNFNKVRLVRSNSVTPSTWTVTSSAGTNGTINPAGTVTVSNNATQSYTVTPAIGYAATIGGTCGGTYNSATQIYTTNPITNNCTVTASFVVANCAASGISSITQNGFAYSHGYQGFDVNCNNGTYGVVRLPQSDFLMKVKSCAFQQGTCPTKPVNYCYESIPTTAELNALNASRGANTATLQNEPTLGPLARWVCN